MKGKFLEREARRQAVLDLERETGETGVFALVNQQLGDGSEAAKIQQRAQDSQSQTMARNSAGLFSKAKPVPGSSSRKDLVAGQVPPNCQEQQQHNDGMVYCINCVIHLQKAVAWSHWPALRRFKGYISAGSLACEALSLRRLGFKSTLSV